MVENAFREILKSHFPRIKFHGDEEDDDICVRASGCAWECERLFYNRSTEQIRMWRWKGQWDYHFISDDEFIHWLVKHVNAGHKFEEVEKPKSPRKVKHTVVTGTDLHVSSTVLAVKVENLGEEYSTFRCSFVDGCVHVYTDDNGVQQKYIAFGMVNPVNGKKSWCSTRTCPEGHYIVLLGWAAPSDPNVLFMTLKHLSACSRWFNPDV